MFAKLARVVLVACFCCGSMPASAAGCADLWEWLNSGCRRLVDTYENGSNELILSGYAWHAPWTWTAETRAEDWCRRVAQHHVADGSASGNDDQGEEDDEDSCQHQRSVLCRA